MRFGELASKYLRGVNIRICLLLTVLIRFSLLLVVLCLKLWASLLLVIWLRMFHPDIEEFWMCDVKKVLFVLMWANAIDDVRIQEPTILASSLSLKKKLHQPCTSFGRKKALNLSIYATVAHQVSLTRSRYTQYLSTWNKMLTVRNKLEVLQTTEGQTPRHLNLLSGQDSCEEPPFRTARNELLSLEHINTLFRSD